MLFALVPWVTLNSSSSHTVKPLGSSEAVHCYLKDSPPGQFGVLSVCSTELADLKGEKVECFKRSDYLFQQQNVRFYRNAFVSLADPGQIPILIIIINTWNIGQLIGCWLIKHAVCNFLYISLTHLFTFCLNEACDAHISTATHFEKITLDR